jgi:hypothetical protein
VTAGTHHSAARRADQLEHALHLVVVAALAGILAAGNDILAIDAFREGSRTFSVLDHADTLRVGAFRVQLVVLVVAAVFYLRWQTAAVRNLPGLGATPRWPARAAAVAWLLPGLNLMRPKQVVNDLWRSGDPDAPTRSPADALQRLAPGRLTHAWWALWIAAWAVGVVGVFASQRTTLAQYRAWDVVDAVSNALILVAAAVTIALTRAITERQDARAAGLADRMRVGLAAGLPPRVRPRRSAAAAPGPAATDATPRGSAGSRPG